MLDWVTATASTLSRALSAVADRFLVRADGVAPGSAGGSVGPVAPMPDSSAQGLGTG